MAQDKPFELTQDQKRVVALHDSLSRVLGGPPQAGGLAQPYWDTGGSGAFDTFFHDLLTDGQGQPAGTSTPTPSSTTSHG